MNSAGRSRVVVHETPGSPRPRRSQKARRQLGPPVAEEGEVAHGARELADGPARHALAETVEMAASLVRPGRRLQPERDRGAGLPVRPSHHRRVPVSPRELERGVLDRPEVAPDDLADPPHRPGRSTCRSSPAPWRRSRPIPALRAAGPAGDRGSARVSNALWRPSRPPRTRGPARRRMQRDGSSTAASTGITESSACASARVTRISSHDRSRARSSKTARSSSVAHRCPYRAESVRRAPTPAPPHRARSRVLRGPPRGWPPKAPR